VSSRKTFAAYALMVGVPAEARRLDVVSAGSGLPETNPEMCKLWHALQAGRRSTEASLEVSSEKKFRVALAGWADQQEPLRGDS